MPGNDYVFWTPQHNNAALLDSADSSSVELRDEIEPVSVAFGAFTVVRDPFDRLVVSKCGCLPPVSVVFNVLTFLGLTTAVLFLLPPQVH